MNITVEFKIPTEKKNIKQF